MKLYLCIATTREIWDALSKAFYGGSDELQVFSLNQKAFIAKQGEKSLFVYYGELCEIFRELDYRDNVVMEQANDVATRDSKRRGPGRNATSALTEGKADGDNEVANRATALIATAGATDHMTLDSKQISSLKQSFQQSVSTANGTSVLVIGEVAAMSLTDTLNLASVLVVPSLEYNLFLDTIYDEGSRESNEYENPYNPENALDTGCNEDSHWRFEETTPLSESLSPQPNTYNQSLVEDAPESVPNSLRRHNPPHSNRGILKPMYEPELTSKVLRVPSSWDAVVVHLFESVGPGPDDLRS
ncbi:hypothetical protein RHSIM_Rhsim04G0133500 [Rhododendron simsii]|uniref:Retrovirus-related Pol polyprotein from transposon TNT 1-94-like beta-barrel domain-containing protein n=1 Tax=Rhododendron simsii TaxID=118357 RepID=A0A834H5Q0_RHOSS|nr:hypothetical protein RHSIM_Rhsim04G0133500 [Rhododendron simsii]